MMVRHVAVCLALVLAVSGCSAFRRIVGFETPGDPSVTLRSAEPRWLLIKNPRFGDVPSEPEYVWVEEDKVPTTFKTLIRGKGSIIAPPEIVAHYGSPPGGGKISPRQKMPVNTLAASPPSPAKGSKERGGAPKGSPNVPTPTPAAGVPPAAPEPKRGYVVYVDTTRIAIDLTSADGVHPGSIVSIRRIGVPIPHPITGEILGNLDEEIATARVTETQEKMSFAEIDNVSTGSQVQLKDRVVPK